MLNPSVHTRRVGECARAHNSAFGTSRWRKTRSRTRVAGFWSQAPDLAADRFLGDGVIQDGFSKDLYFGHAKKDRDRLEPDRMIRIRSTPAF